MARVTCPFCLKPHDFSVSHGCTTYPNEVIPDEYISEYDRVQPLWLLTVGFKQHGKTTYLAALKLVSTTWFLISLRDLENDEKGRAITDLFNVYRSGMRKLQADLKGRTLIVIYTKADQVAFTPEIEEYLASDPYQGLTLPDAQ